MSEPSSSCQKLNNRTGEKVKQQTPCLKIESGSSQQMPETKPVHLAPKALENSSGWATVVEEKTKTKLKIPIQNDNTISLPTILLLFPGTNGMFYNVPQCNHMQWIACCGKKLLPPPNGWGNNVYHCVSVGENESWFFNFCSCVFEKAKQQAEAVGLLHRQNNVFMPKVLVLKKETKKIKSKYKASKPNKATTKMQSENNVKMNVVHVIKNKKNKANKKLVNSEVGNQNKEKNKKKLGGNSDKLSENNSDTCIATSKVKKKKKKGSKSNRSALSKKENGEPEGQQIAVTNSPRVVRMKTGMKSMWGYPGVNSTRYTHSSTPAEKETGLINNVLKSTRSNEHPFPQSTSGNDSQCFWQTVTCQTGDRQNVTTAVNYVLHGNAVAGKGLFSSESDRSSEKRTGEPSIANSPGSNCETHTYVDVKTEDNTLTLNNCSKSDSSSSTTLNENETNFGQCSGLVVHNLSHSVSESQLREYFMAYGEVNFQEIRTVPEGGRTGFVGFEKVPVRQEVLSEVYHFIGDHWCFVQLSRKHRNNCKD